MNKPDDIDEALEELNKIAMDYDGYAYGLPTHIHSLPNLSHESYVYNTYERMRIERRRA